MQITRRQHYVWRYYLEGWAVQGRICVGRKDGKYFNANPANVGLEKDFYRLPPLSATDEEFIRGFIRKSSTNSHLINLNIAWIDNFALPSRLRRHLESLGPINKDLENAIREVEIQSEEELHSSIEGPAVRLLDNLRTGNVTFWNDDDDALEFSLFISMQHLRTKSMKKRVISAMDNTLRPIATRTWPALRTMLSTNLGWSIYSERQRWRMRSLSPRGRIKFITSDQPVTNILVMTGNSDDLALYYPVSPERSMLMELIDSESSVGSDDNLTDEMVDSLNRKILEGTHEQAFGGDMAYLKQLMTV